MERPALFRDAPEIIPSTCFSAHSGLGKRRNHDREPGPGQKQSEFV
jgi:hypothetical protein